VRIDIDNGQKTTMDKKTRDKKTRDKKARRGAHRSRVCDTVLYFSLGALTSAPTIAIVPSASDLSTKN
jgi:hypothetical protein